MTTEPTTDSERLHLWLDPVLTAAIDAARGKQTRAAFVIGCIAKTCKLKDYKPRSRGRPKSGDKP